MAFGYRIPKANQAMLVSGGRTKKDEPPVKVILGHGKFVLPGIRRAQYLDLSMSEAQVAERCYTAEGFLVGVKAICAFKVADDPNSIINAAQRFLDDQKSMVTRTGAIFAGHLRSIVGSMALGDIITQRQKLADEVLDASKKEMGQLGLLVDSFQIESIDDQGAGIIENMSAPHTATIKQRALIAQAEADRAAAEAQQASVRKQAEYQRDTETTKAQYTAEVTAAQAKAQQAALVAQAQADQASQVARAQANAAINQSTAEAEQAGPLARAIKSQEVAEKETTLATQQALLTEQRLLSEKVKPAEAAKLARIAEAEAEAEATRLAAEAANSADRVQLDQLLIEQLPEMVQAAASGLSGADLTILNGTEGVNKVVSDLAAQGLTLYNVFRGIKHTDDNRQRGNETLPARRTA